ncbi:hypothetical protein GW17_00055423 [Ensete ventricosum]|nr:hypothetical protein GW17_00055423 [Ensete ventricosum]
MCSRPHMLRNDISRQISTKLNRPSIIGVTRELDCFSTYIHLREPDKSEDKVDRERGRGGGEYSCKLQIPRKDRRAEIKELYKIGVNRLLIKIAKSERLRVDAGVLDQGMK